MFSIGEKVLCNGEESTVVESPNGRYPFDIWIFIPSRGYPSCYAFSSVKKLPRHKPVLRLVK